MTEVNLVLLICYLDVICNSRLEFLFKFVHRKGYRSSRQQKLFGAIIWGLLVSSRYFWQRRAYLGFYWQLNHRKNITSQRCIFHGLKFHTCLGSPQGGAGLFLWAIKMVLVRSRNSRCIVSPSLKQKSSWMFWRSDGDWQCAASAETSSQLMLPVLAVQEQFAPETIEMREAAETIASFPPSFTHLLNNCNPAVDEGTLPH